MCKENNVRDRVLSKNEFARLQKVSPPHLKPINLMGYYTAMRIGEILKLKWKQIDFKKRIIRLYPEDTKTLERRDIPLNEALTNMLQSLTRHILEMNTYSAKLMETRIKTLKSLSTKPVVKLVLRISFITISGIGRLPTCEGLE